MWIACAGDQNVFVATADGLLHLLRLPKQSYESADVSSIRQTNVGTSVSISASDPVTQLVPIVSKNLVIAVTGKSMVVCGIGPDGAILNYETRYQMKGKVDLVCVDESSDSSVRICAVSHPEIHMYALVDRHKLRAKEGLHYTPGRATSVALLREGIALGYTKPRREYNLIRTSERGEVDTLPVTPVQREDPLVVRTDEDEVLFTTSASSASSSECVGVLVNGRGEPTRAPITWPEPPTSVYRCDPYIVGVTSRSAAVRVHWFSMPIAMRQPGGPTGAEAGLLMQTVPLPFKPVASCRVAMWGPSYDIGWQESVLLAGRRGADKRPCLELLLQTPPEAQSAALLQFGMHESAETLAIMREQLREAEAEAASTDLAAAAERQAANRVVGGGVRRRLGGFSASSRRAAADGLGVAAVDGEEEQRLPVLEAVRRCGVDPPALPMALEEQRRASVLGEEACPPIAAAAKTRGPAQAAALAGVAPRDAESQAALKRLDGLGEAGLRGPGLDGRQLPAALRQFHTRAGCVMLLRLQFDAALRHLCLGSLDPREVIWLSPALHEPGFSYAPEVLTRGLCSAVARGEKSPGLAAATLEERGFDRSLAVTEVDLSSIIEAVRTRQFEVAAGMTRAEAGGAAASVAGMAVAGAMHEEWGASSNAVRRAARAIAAAGAGKTSAADTEATSLVETERGALMMLQSFLLQRRQFPETHWLTAEAREDLDIALMRIMALTSSMAELCAFVSRETDLSTAAAASFCVKQGLTHVMALLERARGFRADALERWKTIFIRPGGDRAVMKLCTMRPMLMHRFWQPRTATEEATDDPERGAASGAGSGHASPSRGGHTLHQYHHLHHRQHHHHRHRRATEEEVLTATRAVALTCAVETLQSTEDLAVLGAMCEWVALAAPRRCLSVFCCPRRISLPVKELRPLLSDLDKLVLRSRSRGSGGSGTMGAGTEPPVPAGSGVWAEDDDEDFVLRPMEQRFLFYLVYAVGMTDSQIHTALARSLVSALLQCRGETASAARREEGAEAQAASASAARHATHKYREGLREGRPAREAASNALDALEGWNSKRGERLEPGTEAGSEGELRRDLLELLRFSRFYDAPRLLGAVGGTSLLEERVLLHGRTGNHAAAIQVCLAEMGDLARAEAYCIEAYRSAREEAALGMVGGGGMAGERRGMFAAGGSGAAGAASRGNPFMELFRQMQGIGADVGGGGMGSAGSAMLPEALLLMERHSRKVSLTQAMEALPDAVSVSSVNHLLLRLVPAAESRFRAARVLQHVSELERLQANVELTRAQQHYAIIHRETTCAVSGQPINRQRFVLRAPRSVDHTRLELQPVLQSVAARRHK